MTINLRTREGWDDLKRLLDERPDDVLRLCGIDVKRLGGGWTVIDDPLGRGRDCFGLCLRGGFLTWKQFNGDAKGRALELIAYCNGWYDQDKRGAEPAARLALQHFGFGNVSADELARGRAQAAARRAEREDAASAERDRKAQAAFAAFVNAKPVLGTPADEYLHTARGIDLRAAPFIGPRGGNLAPACLRYIHGEMHIDERGQRTRWPCLVACCVDADMHIRAVHRTWLNHAGTDKAPVIPARKVWADGPARTQQRHCRQLDSGPVGHAVGSRLRMPGRADRLRGRLQVRDRQHPGNFAR
jgi:hypothetical protein